MHLRDRALVVGEAKTGEHSVLPGQVRGQTLRLEHVSLHHGEVGVRHRLQLAGVPHQGGDGVSPRQGLLHCLHPWVQTTKLELLNSLQQAGVRSPVCPVAPSIASFIV